MVTARTIEGMERNTSVNRMMMASVGPPKYPAVSPRITPTDELNGHDADADDQRVTAPVDDPGQHVPAIPVRAQRVLERGAREHVIEILLDRVVARKHRRKRGRKKKGEDDRSPGQSAASLRRRRKAVSE